MLTNWLQDSNPWLLFPVSVAGIFLAILAGQALGQAVRARHGPEGAQHLTPLQGALIGLLSLMIGFTFSLSAARLDARKAAVLSEANAISTAQERAALLPAPHADQALRLLASYLDVRIELGSEGRRPSEQRAAIARSLWLQASLWKVAAAAVTQSSQPMPGGLFVQALNDMGDMHELRLAADRNQVPRVVFLMLEGLAIVAWGFTGYAAGRGGARNMLSNLVLASAFATVIALVADLDRPGSGLVRVQEEPLLDLKAGLHEPFPTRATPP